MGLNIFCKHKNYEVITWRYQNLNKPDQKILAKIRCQDCGKVVDRIIEGDTMDTFAFVYEDKFAL